MTSPLISAVIPAHNSANFIGDTIRSIFNFFRFFQKIELIIVDDGSSDNTVEVLETFKMNHPEIKIIKTKQNGVANARNIGAYQATGEWLFFIDADDLLNAKLSKHVFEIFSKSVPSISWVSFRYRKFFDSDFPVCTLKEAPYNDVNFYSLDPLNFPICVGSQFIRKELFDQLGGFPAGETIGEDMALWGKLGDNSKLRLFDSTILFYRQNLINLPPKRETSYYSIFPLIKLKLDSTQLSKAEKKFLFRYSILNIFILKRSNANFKIFTQMILRFGKHSRLAAIKLSIFAMIPVQIFEFIRIKRLQSKTSV